MTISVLVADDHPIFRHGLREAITQDPRLKLVAEAGDGQEAMALIRTHRPDVAVLDIAMPEADGLDVLAHAARWPDAPGFIMLTMYDDEAYFHRALELGALGYMLKESAEAELVQAVLAVSQGRRFFSPRIGWEYPAPESGQAGSPLDNLTATERRILHLIAHYKTSRQIGELLNISHRTVQNHRANICGKLNITGRNALLRYAVEHGEVL